MNIIEGRKISEAILEKLKVEILQKNLRPKLAIVQIGSEEPSNVYVSMKQKAAQRIGVETEVYHYESKNVNEVLKLIEGLNKDTNVNGIILQLPTPGIQSRDILNNIAPEKDVDGLTLSSLGNIWHNSNNRNDYIGATPKAIIATLEHVASLEGIQLQELLSGKNSVIINHNILIGRPLAGILLNYNATVSILHEFTNDINQYINTADIIITATGKRIIDSNNSAVLKQGVIIIDSGYALVDGKSIGDVELESIKDKASYVTPVPGGIGPIAVAMLMQNTVEAFVNQQASQVSL